MECSAYAKISALRAVYREFFAAAEADRKRLINAFFWIADELEDQLQADGNLGDATFAAFQEVKDFADIAFMDPAQWAGREDFEPLVVKLVKRLTESEDRAW
jgi:hypothetical protein